MNIKKIFATDLDGTFLRPDHSFDRVRLRHILDRFKEKGYLFVVASGRSLIGVMEVFEEFASEIAFVAENGSLVSYQDHMIFEDAPISPELYLSIVDGIDKGPYGSRAYTVLSGRTGCFLLEEADPDYFQTVARYYPNAAQVKDYRDVTAEVVKLVANFPEEELLVAREWINSTFDGVTAVTTGFDSVDIIVSEVNKAVGLHYLCQHLGLTGQDIVAFGDNQNDLEMLDFAGTALATENAIDSVKEAAHQIIGNCADDAVLNYIETYLDNEEE